MINTLDLIKEELEKAFIESYKLILSFDPEDAAEIAKSTVESKIRKKYPELLKTQIEEWLLEIYDKHVQTITIIPTAVIRSDKEGAWSDSELTFAYYWSRYYQYLDKIKGWPTDTIHSIDTTTTDILKNIGNPNKPGPFDYRGLVLGYVQSGKTANFTGLINKAYDVGYKLVIVLAGMHNDLRAQTQLRLEKEVVGITDPETKEVSGVAAITNKGDIVQTWTDVINDISITQKDKRHNLNVPNLMVVKKNKDVLETLNKVIAACCNLSESYKDIPVLIIDDEADQASVDTSKPNEDPKTINSLIRQLMNQFTRKSYVGYTATPFANLLINSRTKHEVALEDLYPKDFIISLPKPNGYCGPEEYFNVTGLEEDNKPVYIRHLAQEDLDFFDKIKSKDDVSLITYVPSSLKKAIQSFIISTAIRNLRNQHKEHNSMLIHASHLTDIQIELKSVVETYFEELSNTILYAPNDETIKQLHNMYLTDFVAVQKIFNNTNTNNQFPILDWIEVYSEIKEVLKCIEILVINGESNDILYYDSRKEIRRNVIVIGGNKLSRGLTLDGLTTSYYYRGTSMYDSLLQMGRWFGFRNGYMDLCRIYTSDEIAENFEHLAEVMYEIRQEFEWLAKHTNLTPYDYATSVLGHDFMDVTSTAKMKSAEFIHYYGGKTVQTRSFESTRAFYETNMAATVKLVNSIDKFETVKPTGGKRTKYHLAKDVPVELIINYLNEYLTVSSAPIANSKKIADFILKQNSRGLYSHFNVAVIDITNGEYRLHPYEVELGKLKLESAVVRSPKVDKNPGEYYVDLGAIVSNQQNLIDLVNNEERDYSNPLLLVYPLHPEIYAFKKLNIEFNKQFVPIGIGFHFPRIFKKNLKGEIVEARQKYIKNKTVRIEMESSL